MNIASERRPPGTIVNNAQLKGSRVLLKRAETKRPPQHVNNNNNSTQNSSHNQNRVVLKVVIRLLPPRLTESDFFAQVKEYVNDETTDDKYYVQGCYSDIPFQLPTFSRAYVLFKEESFLNNFMDYINRAQFQNSDGVKQEETYTPSADLALYEKMDFPKSKKSSSPLSPLENDPVYKAFMEWYNIEDPAEKALSRPSSFIKSVAKARLAEARKNDPSRKKPSSKKRSESRKTKGKDTKDTKGETKTNNNKDAKRANTKTVDQSRKPRSKDSSQSRKPKSKDSDKSSESPKSDTVKDNKVDSKAVKKPRRPRRKPETKDKDGGKSGSAAQESSKGPSTANKNTKGNSGSSKPKTAKTDASIATPRSKIKILKKNNDNKTENTNNN